MASATIRRLEPADARAYRTLRLRALAEHPEAFTSSAEEEAHKPLAWSQDRLRADAERPHDFFLGAFAAEKGATAPVLVGMAGLTGRYRPKERHNATLVGMYVAPEVAGQGLGRALVEELLRLSRGLPTLELVDLTVTEGNASAEHLYEHCGFVRCGRLPDAVCVAGRYHAKLEMQLRLRPRLRPPA